ncbi:sensor histidine kinase/response regulator [Pseudomonas sp. Os17]|uniref:ATP-binding protein n=1 Tax=unclassified Pseudomonas TaxID=196821 RepID=UPI0005FC4779|nr:MULTISPECIES: ATP-binding protein [unclassified Pseudomonas]ULT73180.1 ATP-binding protein [Pseudomonas sp. BC42]BAQ75471.1 sensor histidine kinase/response regulator [Pseudomonas sp. Os17]
MHTPAHFPALTSHFSGSYIPVVLLRLFMYSLLFCILIIAGFVIQWSLNETLSNYRRQMNAAAFNAQQFFNQRESLLKAISSSAVRTSDDRLSSSTRNFLATNEQLRVLPFGRAESPRWALVLTARDLVEVDNTHSQLLYLAPEQGLVSTLYEPPGSQPTPPSDNASAAPWLKQLDQRAAQNLLTLHPGARTLWYWAGADGNKQVYLLRPVDEHHASEGWLGLELTEIDLALDPLGLHQGKYLLYDAEGALVLHSANWQVPGSLARLQADEDSFGLHRLGGLPDYIVLNKSVGNAGWRLVYYAPVSQLLQDSSGPLYSTLLVTLLLFAAIFLGARYIRLRLVEPAMRHYSALADSVSLNRRFIEVAPVGLCLMRRDNGRLILCNESGRRWLTSVPGLCERILGEPHSRVHAIDHALEDGTFIQLTCAPTGYNGVAAVLCCISDVTDFKVAEQSLLQAKLLSDQANREKTLFLSTLSHEIRTPMYGILGSLEMLRTTALSTQQGDYLEATQQASSALMRTINDTLDLSLIESGRLSLNHAPFSAIRLVEEVAFSYSARARSKGLRLYVTLDPNVAEQVLGDGERIRQILNNLVSNAIKFTESGHVVLRLHAEAPAGQAPRLRFQVVDSGPGIAPEFQANLFEPYYRVPNWLGQKTSGTGLGLAICQRLACMMQGQLTAISEPGLGSSFSFSLALEPCNAAPAPDLLRLGVTPVYVRGDVQEVNLNLCHWLRRWGALATPYVAERDPPSRKAVLVEAFLGPSRPVAWSGPRVIMHAPGMGPPQRQASDSWIARTFSLDSLRNAVAQAQSGIVAERRFASPEALAPSLDLKLLAVDDSPLSLQVIFQQGRYLGNHMVACASAIDALKRDDLLSFDGVLTDLQMEHMDGLAFARTLRERGFCGPIIGITGELSPVLRSRCEAAGIRQLLLKPVPLDALSEVLQSIKRKVM